jgi:hypothetical protein
MVEQKPFNSEQITGKEGRLAPASLIFIEALFD